MQNAFLALPCSRLPLLTVFSPATFIGKQKSRLTNKAHVVKMHQEKKHLQMYVSFPYRSLIKKLGTKIQVNLYISFNIGVDENWRLI